MKPLRILFVLENYHPHIGGVELVFKNICEGLAKKGHTITVLTHHIPNTPKKETINGVHITRINCLDNRYLFTFASITTALRLAKQHDIIHTTTFNGAPPAWLAARLTKKPVIITVHESWIGKWRTYTNFSRPRAALHELLERSVFTLKYDEYACVSESTAQQLRTALPQRASHIITIHNGFDPTPWEKHQDTKELRTKLHLNNKYVIFAYGRPGTSKGFHYLIQAFPDIKKKIPNATLVLMLSRDKQYAKEVTTMKAQAPPDVIFLDSQPYQELPRYTHMADCIVVPSITEGFGYVALESVASGIPVVATNTTSIPEVIYGKHILVTPRNPQAISDGVIKIKKGNYYTTPTKKFPWSNAITSYEHTYKTLLNIK